MLQIVLDYFLQCPQSDESSLGTAASNGNPPGAYNCKKHVVLGYNAPSYHVSSADERRLNWDMTKLKCCKNTPTGNLESNMKQKSLSSLCYKTL